MAREVKGPIMEGIKDLALKLYVKDCKARGYAYKKPTAVTIKNRIVTLSDTDGPLCSYYTVSVMVDLHPYDFTRMKSETEA